MVAVTTSPSPVRLINRRSNPRFCDLSRVTGARVKTAGLKKKEKDETEMQGETHNPRNAVH